ncbi:transglycosylase domain-containing protein [bacterium]|nr:transglycosylase domain-containing protein [bacterium]
MKNFFLTYWKILSAVIAAMLVLIVFAGPPLAHMIIRDKIDAALRRIENKTHTTISLTSIDFPSATSMTLRDFSIRLAWDSSYADYVPSNEANPDSLAQLLNLVTIKNMMVDFYLFGFLSGNYIRAVSVDSVVVNLFRKAEHSYNFTSFIEGLKAKTDSAAMPTSVSDQNKNKIADFIQRYLDKRLPSVAVQGITLRYVDFDGSRIHNKKTKRIRPTYVASLNNGRLELHESMFRDAQFELSGEVTQPGQTNTFTINGTLNHSQHQLYVNGLFDAGFKIPFVETVTDAKIYLKNFDAQLLSLEENSDYDRLHATLNIYDLGIHSDAVADEKLTNMSVGFDLNLDLARDKIIINPQTRFYLNKINFNVDGEMANLHDQPMYQFHVVMPEIAINDFMFSIPTALKRKLDGFNAKGSMAYAFDLKIDMAHLDSIRFDPEFMLSNDFKLYNLGDSINVRKLLDTTFSHSVITEDGDDSVIVVGKSNKYFTPLDSIPPYLVKAVLFCEDVSFFKNDGFNLLQIQKSIADNIRSKRFARGASTISMQFIKNIYLSREKTISRKFQELILTWLINREKMLDRNKIKENHKKRLLEIYLNIIEWGPDVYGIGRASEFYFKKNPVKLTVQESVFLATIIPNPKKYGRYFDNGVPKNVQVNLMNLMVKLLYEDSVITKEQMEKFTPVQVRITGEAAKYIDGYAADSTDVFDELDLPTRQRP